MSKIVESKESLVTSDGKIVGKDYTVIKDDGSSETTHVEADMDWMGVHGGRTTGVSYNKPDGTTTHQKK